jgi:hypothetical protein
MFVAGGRFLGFRMPDELRSPIKHHLVLHRIDPERGIRRFYTLMIGRDLFRTVRPVSNWGSDWACRHDALCEPAASIRMLDFHWQVQLRPHDGLD